MDFCLILILKYDSYSYPKKNTIIFKLNQYFTLTICFCGIALRILQFFPNEHECHNATILYLNYHENNVTMQNKNLNAYNFLFLPLYFVVSCRNNRNNRDTREYQLFSKHDTIFKRIKNFAPQSHFLTIYYFV